MTKRKSTIISICLFIVIFSALLVTATFTDLQVSQFLTQFSLPKGQYYANDTFGRAFEAVGCAPIYLMIAFALQIVFWNCVKFLKDKFFRIAASGLSAFLATLSYYIMFNDIARYYLEQIGEKKYAGQPFITLGSAVIACIMCFFATLAVRNFKDETIKKLLPFAIAVLLMAAISNGFVNLIKIPVGRPRYRAMNTESAKLIGGFANYKRWYVFNGQPDKNYLQWYYGSTDACKSFPSGHTCSAGMSYGLIMLIDALGIKAKWKKITLWVCPIVYTGIVAVSRIMVGAHFFSDVLIGGTVAFLTMLLMREIFICRFSHFKKKEKVAVKASKKKAKAKK
jgi:membrane-associated phospholipid phosphatase